MEPHPRHHRLGSDYVPSDRLSVQAVSATRERTE
jgi:hypothetical protein